ncbi:MAG TPA: enoyl-CoA hydratase, partial [Rhizobiales bacterium]|nr:enoyl-CoA hydratase [Hyphomicrobiales bacterium]
SDDGFFGITQTSDRVANFVFSFSGDDIELLLTGDRFSPQRAYEMGLINKVAAHEQLLEEAFALAHRIIRHSPLAASRIITAVTRGINTTIDEGLLIEREQFARMAATSDVREGLHAWIERREPIYAGQ